jgi:hypothetical protein
MIESTVQFADLRNTPILQKASLALARAMYRTRTESSIKI